MSYSEFLNDLNSVIKNDNAKGIGDKMTTEDVFATVRDQWIQRGKINELISFIHKNWDSGNCDDFIAPLETYLIKKGQAETYIHLWKKILNYRLSNLWTYVKQYKKKFGEPDVEKIKAADISGFNEFSTESYKDLKQVVAYHRQFAIDGLSKMKNGLLKLGQSTTDLEIIIGKVSALKPTTLK